MNAQDQIRNGANPYGVTLAENINKALPKAKCVYGGGNIYLYLPDSAGYNVSSKGWLHTMLEGLPEIDAPLQRLQIVVYVNEAIKCVTIINPSKFDVIAMYEAKEAGLKFSSPPPASWELEPLPLDHPYYTQKGWLDKQLKKKKENQKIKDISFDVIKHLPNVKPILKEMRKDGIKI